MKPQLIKLLVFLFVAPLVACSTRATHEDSTPAPAPTPMAALPAPPAKSEPTAAETGPAEGPLSVAQALEKVAPTSKGGPEPKIEIKKAKKSKAIEVSSKARSQNPEEEADSTEAALTASRQTLAPAAPDSHSLAPNPNVDKAAAAASQHASAKKEGVDPNQALKWLENGNKRFLKGFLRKDGSSMKDVRRLSSAQDPHTIILSCSDSRVPPELVFDQKLGEIFVIRTAGESLDANVIGSIEYAVEHLGSRLIVVMGHTSCGAIKAAVATVNGADAGSPSLNALVEDIHPRIRPALESGGASADFAKESTANAKGVAIDLVQRSALLRDAVTSGRVMIKTALYHLGSGEVQFQ